MASTSVERAKAQLTKDLALMLELGAADLSLAQPVNWCHICPHCARAFPSCHALGGHQNAHRQLKREAGRSCLLRVGCVRNAHVLSAPPPPPPPPPGIMIPNPNTDLKLAPHGPTAVKPIPFRMLNPGAGYANGVAFELGSENYYSFAKAVGLQFKPPVPIEFLPGSMSACADNEDKALSDEENCSIEVDSDLDMDMDMGMDLDLKL